MIRLTQKDHSINNICDVVLFFPPVFDSAMPYVALPSLAAALHASSSYKCITVDLNQCFFSDAIAKIEPQLDGIRKACERNNLLQAVPNVLAMQTSLSSMVTDISHTHDTCHLSLRQFSGPWDLKNSANIHAALTDNRNPFIPFFHSYLLAHLYQCELFGISLAAEDQILPCFTLANILKELYPAIPIVLGGTVGTRLAHSVMASSLSSLFDYYIVFDGERALRELLDSLVRKAPASPCHPSIIDNSQEPFRLAEHILPTEEITDLNTLPTPDFFNGKIHSYYSPYPVLPVYAGRGCPWGKCEFCAIPKTWEARYRSRDIVRVVDDLSKYVEHLGVSHFRFVDESIPPQYLKLLCEQIIDRGLNIFFEAYCRLEPRSFTKELCDIISQAGCRQIFFGLESLGQITRDIVQKGPLDMPALNSLLETTSNAGILNFVFALFGIPGGPILEEEKTVQYLIDNPNVHVVTLGSFLVDMYSPIETSEQIRKKMGVTLFSIGDMTTEIGHLVNGKDERVNVATRCERYLTAIYDRRPDLALTSLLNDELRLILTARFGCSFAQKSIASREVDTNKIKDLAISRVVHERVSRNLGEDDVRTSH